MTCWSKGCFTQRKGAWSSPKGVLVTDEGNLNDATVAHIVRHAGPSTPQERGKYSAKENTQAGNRILAVGNLKFSNISLTSRNDTITREGIHRFVVISFTYQLISLRMLIFFSGPVCIGKNDSSDSPATARQLQRSELHNSLAIVAMRYLRCQCPRPL